MHTETHIYTHRNMHTCMHIGIYTERHMHTYHTQTQRHIYMHKDIYGHTDSYVRYRNTHTCIHRHMTDTYKYIFISYTCTQKT